jgi:hypothetical protein
MAPTSVHVASPLHVEMSLSFKQTHGMFEQDFSNFNLSNMFSPEHAFDFQVEIPLSFERIPIMLK